MDKLIVFPLCIMFLVSVFAFLIPNSGYNANDWNGQNIPLFGRENQGVSAGGGEPVEGYFDNKGHCVAHLNGSCAGEDGTIQSGVFAGRIEYVWYNGTMSSQGTSWAITNSKRGSIWQGGNGPLSGVLGSGFGVFNSFGFLTIVLALMAVSIVIGLRFFGTGVSDYGIDAFFKSSGYLALWTVLSLVGFGVIVAIPWFGAVFYCGLSLMYVLGTINSVGHPSGGD